MCNAMFTPPIWICSRNIWSHIFPYIESDDRLMLSILIGSGFFRPGEAVALSAIARNWTGNVLHGNQISLPLNEGLPHQLDISEWHLYGLRMCQCKYLCPKLFRIVHLHSFIHCSSLLMQKAGSLYKRIYMSSSFIFQKAFWLVKTMHLSTFHS